MRIHFRGTPVLAAAIALVFPLNASAARDMARVIHEEAAFALWAPDMKTMIDAAAASPYGQLLSDPAMADILDAVSEQVLGGLAAKEDGDDPLGDALKSIDGGAAFYLYPTDIPGAMEVVLVLEATESTKGWYGRIKERLEGAFVEPRRSTVTVDGQTLFRLQGHLGDPTFFSQQDPMGDEEELLSTVNHGIIGEDYIFFSSAETEDLLRHQVALLTGAGGRPLGTRTDAGLVPGMFAPEANKVFGFLNVASVLKELTAGLTGADATAEAKLESVGARDFESLYLSVGFSKESVEQNLTVTLPRGARGLVDAIFPVATTSGETLRFSPAEVLGASYFHFDFSRFWDAASAAVETFQPGAMSFANLMFLSAQSNYGVDPLGSILRNISGEHLTVNTVLAPELIDPDDPLSGIQASSAGLLAFRNGDDTFAAVKTLLTNIKNDPNYGTMFEMEEVDGRLVIGQSDSANQGPIRVSVAVGREGIVLANNAVGLQEILRGLGGKLPQNLAAKPEVLALQSGLNRTGLLAFGFSPQAASGQFFDGLRVMVGAISNMGAEIPFDPEDIPSGDVARRYIGDSWYTLHRAENTLTSVSVLQAAK